MNQCFYIRSQWIQNKIHKESLQLKHTKLVLDCIDRTNDLHSIKVGLCCCCCCDLLDGLAYTTDCIYCIKYMVIPVLCFDSVLYISYSWFSPFGRRTAENERTKMLKKFVQLKWFLTRNFRSRFLCAIMDIFEGNYCIRQ